MNIRVNLIAILLALSSPSLRADIPAWLSSSKYEKSDGWKVSDKFDANGFVRICKKISEKDQDRFICYGLDRSTGFCVVNYSDSNVYAAQYYLPDPGCIYFKNAEKYIDTTPKPEKPKPKLWYPYTCGLSKSCIDGKQRHFDNRGYETQERCMAKAIELTREGIPGVECRQE